MRNKTFSTRHWLLLALLQAGLAQGGEAASVHVKTGDLSAVAQGDGAHASISIGTAPGGLKPGCGNTAISVGDIHKQATGRHAQATVNIPETPSNCEEKHP